MGRYLSSKRILIHGAPSANTDGGIVLFGVDASGKWIGWESEILKLEEFEKELMNLKRSDRRHEAKLALLKEKVQKWRQEGYKVDEIEEKLTALEK